MRRNVYSSAVFIVGRTLCTQSGHQPFLASDK